MARGSCVCGRWKSPASCATDSQPTNSQTRMLAAVPIAHQPCGANGVQECPACTGSAVATATAMSRVTTPATSSWARADTRSPSQLAPRTETKMSSATTPAVVVPPPARSAAYRPPITATAGAPNSTAVRNQPPVISPASGPKPARTYSATPPATGMRTPGRRR